MSARRCLNCGGSLPPVPWWKKALMREGHPRHDPSGPDALALVKLSRLWTTAHR